MIIPTGYAQGNIRFTGAALPHGAEVTLGLQIGVPGPTPVDVAESLRDAWSSNIVNFQSADITMTEVLVKFGPNATGPDGAITTSVAGQDGTGMAPPQVTFLVRKTTVDGGRAGRGRMYVPGINEDRIEPDGAVNSEVVEDMTTAFGVFVADLVADDLNPVVLHAAGSPITAPSLITSMVVDPVVATQRRRLR